MGPAAIIALTHRHQERAAFAGMPLGDDEPCPEALHYIYAGGMLLRYLREEEKDKLRGIVLPDVPEFIYDDALWQKDAPAVATTRRRRRSLTQREKAQDFQRRIMANVAAEGAKRAKRQADDTVRSWLSDCDCPSTAEAL